MEIQLTIYSSTMRFIINIDSQFRSLICFWSTPLSIRDLRSFKSIDSWVLSLGVRSGLTYTGKFSLALFLSILVSADLRNFTNNGLGFLFPGLNLPNRYKSFTAWDFIDESMTDNDVTRSCRSCSIRSSFLCLGDSLQYHMPQC